MLTHLHIQHFKGFRDLRIEPLGRVNLITGKNNTGKTSLLEAIMLWDFPAHPGQVLEMRGESWAQARDDHAYLLDSYLSLFYQRKLAQPFQINGVTFQIQNIRDVDLKQFSRGGNPGLINRPEWSVSNERPDRAFYQVIPSRSLAVDELVEWWSKIALTPREDTVLDFLRLIEPRVKRLSVLERVGPKRFFAQLEGESQAIPLPRLGEGINKLLSLILALISAEGGLLLIDEIENGLHYTVQAEMWGYLFRFAQELNVQVFATTHSADCVRAFAETGGAEAFADEARLIRFFQKQGQIGEVGFDLETVQSAVAADVDLR